MTDHIDMHRMTDPPACFNRGPWEWRGKLWQGCSQTSEALNLTPGCSGCKNLNHEPTEIRTMTSTNLPAGVWRDNAEAGKLRCPQERFDNAVYQGRCCGTECAACREYRAVAPKESHEVLGYYCGKAGRP